MFMPEDDYRGWITDDRGLQVGQQRLRVKTTLHPPHPARFSRTSAWSRADKKFERSRGPNGFGPPVISPAERKESIRLRVASAMPIESSVKARPVGASTVAPAFTQRPASGTSAVTTTAPCPARAAIQSSAAFMS